MGRVVKKVAKVENSAKATNEYVDNPIKENSKQYRLVIMAILVSGCCFFTYYCDAVLEMSIVFTHAYYAPIILALIWWRRKGLFVTFFLIAAWFLSHIIFRQASFDIDDFLWVTMLLCIGVLLTFASEKIRSIADKLQQANTYLENLFSYASVPIVVWDPEFKITRFNCAFECLTGKISKDVLGCPIEILFPSDMCDEAMIQIRHTMKGQRWVAVEIPISGVDGTVRTVLWNSANIYASDSRTVIATIAQGQDITEHKQTEAILRDNEKLAATGKLAAQVAHEINNPLAAITGSFRLIKSAVPREHPRYKFVEVIEKELNRIAQIIRQMYGLYQLNPELRQNYPVSKCIEEVISLLKSSCVERGVSIVFDRHSISNTLELPDNIFKQVLYNIIQNAIDASSQGQAVRIITTITNNILTVAVSDSGSAIPEEMRDKIFEPFFTTKKVNEKSGLGLGLSVCKNILETIGGNIEFDSQTGCETTFRINIPIGWERKEN